MKKTLRFILYLTIAIVIIAMIAVSIIFGALSSKNRHSKGIETWGTKLESTWRKSKENHQQVFLPDLTPFPWEKACIIEPYMTQDDIQEVVGDKYEVGKLDTTDEGMFTLLFGLPDKTTKSVLLPRSLLNIDEYSGCRQYEEMKKNPLPK